MNTLNVDLERRLPFKLKLKDKQRNHVLANEEDYQIGPENRDLDIRFMVTGLIESDLYTVSYELQTSDGVNRQAKVPIDEELSFINLNPGEYYFSASANSTSGTHSEVTRFNVTVLPFWWETIVFKVCIVLLLAFLLLIYTYRKSRRVQDRFDAIAFERKRVAQELHDTSLQDIFGAKMLATILYTDTQNEEDKKTTARFVALLDKAILSLRESVDSLSKLTHVPDLSAALLSLDDVLVKPEGVSIQVQESGSPWLLNKQRSFFVYRIVREAVNNALKHSSSNQVAVDVEWSKFQVVINVKDTGVGFDKNQACKGNTYGLNAMHTMAEAANAKLHITSSEHSGTHIRLQCNRWF